MDYREFSELYHHGVKGQQWGKRHYQNADGSYKSGAEGRYYDEVPSKPKAEKKDGHLKTMAKLAWRDRKKIAINQVKSKGALLAYTKGSNVAARLLAQSGAKIATKHGNIEIGRISSNVITTSKPLVLAAIAIVDTVGTVKSIHNYHKEAREIERKGG